MAAALVWAGKALLTLLGVVLAVLLLALIIPAGVTIRQEGGVLHLKAHVLGIPIPILPQKPKTAAQKLKAEEKKRLKKEQKEEKKKQKAQKQKLKEEKKAQKQAAKAPAGAGSAAPAQGKEKNAKAEQPLGQKLAELLHKVGCIVNRAGWLMKKIFGALRISKVVIWLPVTGADAADTANQYGRIWAALSASLAVLYNLLHIKVERIEIVPDYAGLLKGKEVLSCKIQAQLIIMVTAGVYTLVKLKQDKVF
ncbi:MAG: DUF2953 domain-containing protein [Oscillospiraceae bacterium]|nr:DUF2953 domain-containing protein [Oscillospiraceae bacterium]